MHVLCQEGQALTRSRHNRLAVRLPSPPSALPSSVPPSPWRWIPTLYFAQGLPYVVVMTLAVVLYLSLIHI